MMSISWGLTDECHYYIDAEFEEIVEMDWFDDPLVKEILADIDNCIIEGLRCVDLDDPKIKFPIDELSTGSKGLIMLLKLDYDTFRIYGSAFGDNCTKWLLKIAKSRDFILELCHDMNFPEDDFEGFSLMQNRKYNDYEDYRYEMRHWGYQLW